MRRDVADAAVWVLCVAVLYYFCELCVVWVLLFLHVFLVRCVLLGCSFFMRFCCCPCVPKYLSVLYDSLPCLLTLLHLSLTLSTYEKCHREDRAGKRGLMEKMLFEMLREVEVERS